MQNTINAEEDISSQVKSENLLDLFAIPELCNKNFFIPDYQRGYRWGERQVTQLMEDLSEFFSPEGEGKFYCLQPIVVKQMLPEDISRYNLHSKCNSNVWYEVIDGQQRLTTIRIIFTLAHLMDSDNEERFNLEYQTRPDLGKLFDKLTRNVSDPYQIDAPEIQKLNIDSWHILQATNSIMSWLKNKYDQTADKQGLKYFKGTFYENFTHSKDANNGKLVQIIWYELRDRSDQNDTFKRLNDKKVSLNNAELIRSMFLSDSAKYEYDKDLIKQYPEKLRDTVIMLEQSRKQSHIIEEWDIIEKQLHQSEFWAFITQDGKADEYASRIEYIFDLVSKKGQNERDDLSTFLTFVDMIHKHHDKDGKEVKGLWDLWQKVENYFSILQAWYSDSANGYEYYHKIGFLITEQGRKVLINLLDEAQKEDKHIFAEKLNWKIMNDITDGNPDDNIFEYSYDKLQQRSKLWKVIFYYNVESIRLGKIDKFPFNIFKKTEWTLEHIHAQNSERIDRDDKNKWKEWYNENIKALENLQIRFHENDKFSPAQLIISLKEEKNKVDSNNFVFNDFSKSFDSVNAYYDKMAQVEGGTPEIHTLSNMALLSGSVNTIIGNSAFEVKRQLILSLDAAGKFIPYCTRQVFLKYFNRNKPNFTVQQTFYWSEEDRKSYMEDLKKVLSGVFLTNDSDSETTNKEEND